MKSSKGFNRSSFEDFLTSSLALWIISITTAVLMWVYVTGTEESNYVTRKFSCPLEYRALDPQATLRGRVQEVEVEIRGLEEAITRLDYDAISAFVDARNLAPGKRYTQNINVELPSGISLISCVPSQVVVDLVRQVVRLMPVEVLLPKDIPEGYYLEGVEVIPRESGIRGTETDVAKVGSLRVMPTVEELSSGKDLLLPIRFVQSEPFEDSVTLEPAQARVRAGLARGLPRKRVPVNARFSGEIDADYEIRSIVTDPSEVQVEGPAERLAMVEAVDTEMVDISSLAGDQMMVVPLRSPDVEGVTVTGPQSVRLMVQLNEVKAGKQLSNIPVELRGGAGSAWTINPDSVTVTLEGTPSRIDSVSPQNAGLRAWVDLSNIFVTPVTLPVRVEVASDEFQAVKIEPATVTVNAGEGEREGGQGRW